jgi:hypothetical protein
MSERRTVTVNDEHGGRVRVSVGEPVWTGREPAGTGIWLTGLWVGRRRLIAEYYSQWEDRRHPGRCIGTYYQEVTDMDEVIRLCDLTGVERPSFVWVQSTV